MTIGVGEALTTYDFEAPRDVGKCKAGRWATYDDPSFGSYAECARYFAGGCRPNR